MGLVTFTVFIRDENSVPVPNASGQLFLEIYDAAGANLLQTLQSIVDGEIEVTIDGDPEGMLYNFKAVRTALGGGLYSPGHLNLERVSHKVYDPLPAGVPTNDAYLTFESGALQTSPDPNFCRITGLHLHHDGRPFQGYPYSLHERRIPKVIHEALAGGLNGALLTGDRIDLRTDKYGKVVFDLPRGGIYTVVMDDWRAFNSEEPVIVVPDAPSADFIDLLQLYIKSVQYDNTTVNVAVGATAEVTVDEMLLSNGLPGNLHGCDFSPQSYLEPIVTAGAGNVSVSWKSGSDGRTLLIEGLAPGTSEVILQAKDPSETGLPVRLPKPAVLQTPISITVV